MTKGLHITKKEYGEIQKIIKLGVAEIIGNTLKYNRLLVLSSNPKDRVKRQALEIERRAKLLQRTALSVLKEHIS